MSEPGSLEARRFLRYAPALVIGLGLAVYFIRRAGAERTLELVWAAGIWLPALLALQGLIVVLDAFALRCLVGTDRVPTGTQVRAAALANACAVFLPLGRAAGETLRAALFARTLGGARAAGAGVRLQACSLLGTSTACGLAAIVTWKLGAGPALAKWLGLNALVCAALGSAMFGLVTKRVTVKLRRLIERVVTVAPSTASASAESTMLACGFCVAGRLVQTLQYGVGVVAVGGGLDAKNAFAAQGIHLLGASIGDVLPGQLGALEGAYSVFAESLSLPDAPVRVISLAVIMRTALVLLALIGVVVAVLLPRDDAERT